MKLGENWKVFLHMIFLVQSLWQQQNKCNLAMELSIKLFLSRVSSCRNDGQTPKRFSRLIQTSQNWKRNRILLCTCKIPHFCAWVSEMLSLPFRLHDSSQLDSSGPRLDWMQWGWFNSSTVKVKSSWVNVQTQLLHLVLGRRVLLPAQRTWVPAPRCRLQTVAGYSFTAPLNPQPLLPLGSPSVSWKTSGEVIASLRRILFWASYCKRRLKTTHKLD